MHSHAERGNEFKRFSSSVLCQEADGVHREVSIAPGQSAYEQSVTIYHEVLEAASLDAKNPPAMLPDLFESEIDILEFMEREQFGLAMVESLSRLLEAVGF